jgi:hypothetical protein
MLRAHKSARAGRQANAQPEWARTLSPGEEHRVTATHHSLDEHPEAVGVTVPRLEGQPLPCCVE